MFGFRTLKGTDTRELRERAARLQGARRWWRAHRVWCELMRRRPDDPLIKLRTGECLRHLKRPAEAEVLFLEAARLWSDDGQWVQAIAALRLVARRADVDERIAALEARRRLFSRRAVTARPVPEGLRVSTHRLEAAGPVVAEVDGWGGARSVDTGRVSRAAPPPTRRAETRPEPVTPATPAFNSGPEPGADAMPEAVFDELYSSFSSATRGNAQEGLELIPLSEVTEQFLTRASSGLASSDDRTAPPAVRFVASGGDV